MSTYPPGFPLKDLRTLVRAGEANALRELLPEWEALSVKSGMDQYLRDRELTCAISEAVWHQQEECLGLLIDFFGSRVSGWALAAAASTNRVDLLERFIPLTSRHEHVIALQSALHGQHSAMVARLFSLVGESGCQELASHVADPESLDLLAGHLSAAGIRKIIRSAPKGTPLPALEAHLQALDAAAALDQTTPPVCVSAPAPRRM